MVVLLIVFFVLSIGFSFLCSILEAVLLSITPSYITTEVQKGSSIGHSLQAFKKDIDRPLSAILTLNTIAHTVGAIGVGATAGKVFGANYIDLGFMSLSYESIIAVFMTLAILILSEIIPKTLGANFWRSLAPFTVTTLKILMFLLAPFVWVSQLITKSMKSDKHKSVLTRTDFMAMTNAIEQSGGIEQDESTIIRNVLEFEKKTVKEIMSPKTVAVMADAEQTVEAFYNQHGKLAFSRIPIYSEKQDNIVGMVLKDDIYQTLAEDKNETKLKDIKQAIQYVGDKTTLKELFNRLTRQKNHLSVVADDFGNVVGLVSMEDLFETLLGREIMDETDTVSDLQDLAKQKWEQKKNKLDQGKA